MLLFVKLHLNSGSTQTPDTPFSTYLFPFSSVRAVEVIEFLGEPLLLSLSTGAANRRLDPECTEPSLPDTKQTAKQRNKDNDSSSTRKVIHLESHAANKQHNI